MMGAKMAIVEVPLGAQRRLSVDHGLISASAAATLEIREAIRCCLSVWQLPPAHVRRLRGDARA